jgi:CPA2 family monovalent cation:H+ antiporter-2
MGLTAATVVGFGLHRLKLPPVLGYMLTGTLLGPTVLGIIADQEAIHTLAEVGVVLLLFMVGLELSPTKLNTMRGQALRVGLLQMAITTVLLAAALHFGLAAPWWLAVLLGAILALSSTSLVLKGLADQNELHLAHGKLALGTLIVQDLLVIPLMALLPILRDVTANLAQTSQATLSLGAMAMSVATGTGKALVMLTLVVVLSFKLVPWLLDILARSRHRELFTLSVVSLGMGVAVVCNALGLSLEVGALIAGMALSGSLYSRQVMADSRPLRDVFATLFFMSLGLVISVPYLVQHWAQVALTLGGLMGLKAVAALLAVLLVKRSPRTAVWVALALCQSGEFSFLMLSALQTVGTLPPVGQAWLANASPLLLHATVGSMLLTPLLLKTTPLWVFNLPEKAQASPLPYGQLSNITLDATTPCGDQALASDACNEAASHTVLIGYGPIGQQVAQALAKHQQPYVVIDTNPNTVKRLHAQNQAVVFGDATLPVVLEAAHVAQAKAVVITVPDMTTATAIAQQVQALNPEAQLMGRARFASELAQAQAAGLTTVVYEERETGLRLAHDTLLALGLTYDEVALSLEWLNDEGASRAVGQGEEEGLLSTMALPALLGLPTLHTLPHAPLGRMTLMAGTQLEWFTLPPNSPLVGQTLAQSRLRELCGATVIGLFCKATAQRIEATPDTQLHADWVLIAVGSDAQLNALEATLQAS